MKKGYLPPFLVFLFISSLNASAFRSALYPEDWQPSFTDPQGRYLHDFSYAGYRGGESELPLDLPQPVFNVISDYGADPGGVVDSTGAIQSAIADAANAGGGTVYLPEGIYRISVSSPGIPALWIDHSEILLAGDGPDKTFLFNTSVSIRGTPVIRVGPRMERLWFSPLNQQTTPLAADVSARETELVLTEVTPFSVGDSIVATMDLTAALIEEFSMEGKSWDVSWMKGPTFARTIIAVDTSSNTITLDAPIRFKLETANNARVYRISPYVREVGLSGFSIGNVANTATSGFGDLDYKTEGTAAYELHASALIRVEGVEDGWITDVKSYQVEGNPANIHRLSDGLQIYQSRQITVQNVAMNFPQYLGGGGNGYGFVLEGQDCLFSECTAEGNRHNYSFKQMFTNGNVIHRSKAIDGRYGTDFHMWLSMANLLDNMFVSGDWIEAEVRPWSWPAHGQTTTESVIWNTYGEAYHSNKNHIVNSRQFGYGYVIGTQGPADQVVTAPVVDNDVDTSPEDWAEAIGQSADLTPQSLYEDQLYRRTGRQWQSMSPNWNSLPVTKDTTLRYGSFSQSNYGSVFKLELKTTEPVGDWHRESILQFDLPALPEEGASLYLQLSSNVLPQDRVFVEAYKLDSNWEENEVTAASAPTSGAFLGAVEVFPEDDQIYIPVNVSAFSRGRNSVKIMSSGSEYFQFYSRESSFPPMLVQDSAIVLPVAQDSTLRSGSYSESTFGSTPNLELNDTQNPDFRRELLLGFDINEVSLRPRQATLSMVVKNSNSNTVEVLVYAADGEWNEASVDWSSSPPASDLVGSASLDQGPGDEFEVDLTDAVQAVWDSDSEDKRINLRLISSSPGYLSFHSREATDNSLIPNLILR